MPCTPQPLTYCTAEEALICMLARVHHTLCGEAGLATAVVSNFDTRLRPLLGLLGLEPLFDEIIVRRALA